MMKKTLKVQYIAHDEDEIGEMSGDDTNTREKDQFALEHSVILAEGVVSLDIAISAAKAAEIEVSPSNHSTTLLPVLSSTDSMSEQSESDNNGSRMKPPQERTNSTNPAKTVVSSSPLLTPPFEEKLKKWQEEKLCSSKFLVSIANEEGTNNVDLEIHERSLNRKVLHNVGTTTLSDRGLNVDDDVVKKLTISRSKSPSKYLDTNVKDEIYEVNEEALSKAQSSNERNKAIISNIFLSDEKIAEKVALPNSTAAKMLEESLHSEKLSTNLVAHVKTDDSSHFHSKINTNVSNMICGGTVSLQDNLFDFTRESFKSCDPMAVTENSFNVSSSDRKSLITNSYSTSDSSTVNVAKIPNCQLKQHPINKISEEVEETFSKTNSLKAETLNLVADVQEKSTLSSYDLKGDERLLDGAFLAIWLRCILLQLEAGDKIFENATAELRSLLDNDEHFDRLCILLSMKVNLAVELNSLDNQNLTSPGTKVKQLVPFSLVNTAQKSEVLAANFISFLQRIGNITNIESPFQSKNPFVSLIISEKMIGNIINDPPQSMQDLVFSYPGSDILTITRFFYDVAQAATNMSEKSKGNQITVASQSTLRKRLQSKKRYLRPPEGCPSPFETATWTFPGAIVIVLGMLGDPVAVCRMKIINRFCNRVITENEHSVMRDAVRLGGMSMNIRPAFWMWITIENCGRIVLSNGANNISKFSPLELNTLAQRGLGGKWHAVIERDVARAFGNMPPHKTGARLRADSIVRALVTFGRSRLLKRGVRGGGEAFPIPSLTSPYGQQSKPRPRESTAPPPWEVGDENDSDLSRSPTDTVSDWGGVSPVPSFNSSVGEDTEAKKQQSQQSLSRLGSLTEVESEGKNIDGQREDNSTSYLNNGSGQLTMDTSRHSVEELALSGNALSNEMKTQLQDQLSIILHALAARHDDVGYCQGMDYVVAHLLRVLQDTVKWRAMKCSTSTSTPNTAPHVDDSAKVSVFQVMDCFFTTYNLRHMYYPELRSLKICCRVFEKLINLKLPVLADHFEHHELNVGLFALGWFQTLFLYLPSMPTATVCHMWDIWLVERSFKIFFRVGAAILFLSQPILLNHDLEGMMTYLNTFPDATLLKADILIACALQIKVTNRMLTELEMEVTGGV